MHCNGDLDGVRDSKVSADGLVRVVLHQVDVLRDALDVGVKGTHLYWHLDELGVVQPLRTFAEMAD